MADNVADRIFIERDGREVAEATSLDVTQDHSSDERVNTIRRINRSLGRRRGVVQYAMTLEVVVPVTGEYNWQRAMENDARHDIVLQYGKSGNRGPSATGRREVYLDCYITSVGSNGDADGSVTRTVEFQALDRQDER